MNNLIGNDEFESIKNRLLIGDIPPVVTLSDSEVIILNGNIESVAIPEDEPYCVGITTRSGHYYQADGENAVKFLSAFPRAFFLESKNLLKLRDFNEN